MSLIILGEKLFRLKMSARGHRPNTRQIYNQDAETLAETLTETLAETLADTLADTLAETPETVALWQRLTLDLGF